MRITRDSAQSSKHQQSPKYTADETGGEGGVSQNDMGSQRFHIRNGAPPSLGKAPWQTRASNSQERTGRRKQ